MQKAPHFRQKTLCIEFATAVGTELEALGITAYVEAELTKQQIQRIAVDKRVRLIQGVEP